MIIRSGDKYAILIDCNGKNGAISAFIESINEFLRKDNPVIKLFLVVDQDHPQKFKEKIEGLLQSLTKEFPKENICLTTFQEDNALHKAVISRKTKKNPIGIYRD